MLAVAVSMSLASACSDEATKTSVVAPWGDLPVTSVCLEIDETWYDVQDDGYPRLDEIRTVDELELSLDIFGDEIQMPEYPTTFDGLAAFEAQVRTALASNGLDIVDTDCDLTVAGKVAGIPLSNAYQTRQDGDVVGRGGIFDGALVVGTIRLEAPGHDPLVADVHGYAREGHSTGPATTGDADPATVDYLEIIGAWPLDGWIVTTTQE